MSFIVYKSSAGSGKTFTLVKEYLRLALLDNTVPPTSYRKIIAITFTNKAASEMKERVLKTLREFSLSDENKISESSKMMLQLLCEETGLKVSEINEKSTLLLKSILHNYSDFGISTIDSFVHKIVRAFARDLKLSTDFEIEMNDEKILSLAVNKLINKAGTDDLISKILLDFAETKASEEKSWHIEKDLLQFSKKLFRENDLVFIEKLKNTPLENFFSIKKKIEFDIKKFENSLQEIAHSAFKLIQEKQLNEDVFYYKNSGIYGYFKKLSDKKIELDNCEPNSYVTKTIEQDKWFSNTAKPDEKIIFESIKNKITQAYSEIQELIKRDLETIFLYSLLQKNMYSMALLSEVEKLLEEIKTENNIVHISEFGKIISKEISEQPVPFIYERLGEKYTNYMIDEFQDTSVIQFRNLLPLFENSLSENQFNMLVGDGKQAIYRWRGGDVKQFSDLPHIQHENILLLKQREKALIRGYEERFLKKNFRSKKEIIQFNNDFFKTLSTTLSENYQGVYKNSEQEFDEKNEGGFVSIEFLKKEEKTFDELNLERIYELILQLQEQKIPFSEVAILVRKNKHGSLIAQYLNEKGINIISSDSLLLKKSSDVNFIFSTLNYLQNSNDTISKTSMLCYILEKNSKNNFHETISKTIFSEANFSHFLSENGFDLNRNFLLKLPLYELCEEIIRQPGFIAKNNTYVHFFLEEVFTFSIQQNATIEAFIEMWEEEQNQPSIVVSEGSEAVNIMTIHHSKGLEFKAVIFPFANWNLSENKNEIWVDIDEKNSLEGLSAAILPVSQKLEKTAYAENYIEEKNKILLDNLNLVYVALTRAEKKLFVLTSSGKENVKEIKNIADMFSYYLQQTNQWQSDKTVYEYGNFISENEVQKNNFSNDLYPIPSFNTQNWRENIKIRTSTNDNNNRKNYGIAVHYALSKIKTLNDIPEAIKKLATKALLSKEELEILEEKLNRMLQLPHVKIFFQEGLTIKSEMEIILRNGTVYRPDRIILEKGKTIVMDYKTGEVSEKYEKQIEKYADALTEMGYKNIEKYIFYIEKETMEKV
ncbi:MAG: UvrD-helicase domain-containing protein [Bacteroidia bacterium]